MLYAEQQRYECPRCGQEIPYYHLPDAGEKLGVYMYIGICIDCGKKFIFEINTKLWDAVNDRR